MPHPIDAIASLTQSQNLLELIHTAQRLQALAALRQRMDTEKAKEVDDTSVTRDQQAEGKTIRDDDPRKQRQRRQNPDDELGNEEQESPPPHIDIVV
jgi:hypothetical protein